jgi:hypothetical protein
MAERMWWYDQRMDQERALTDSQRDEFEDMLRALTLERSQIREAMGFALDNSEAAGEVFCKSFYLTFLCIMENLLFCWLVTSLTGYLLNYNVTEFGHRN